MFPGSLPSNVLAFMEWMHGITNTECAAEQLWKNKGYMLVRQITTY